MNLVKYSRVILQTTLGLLLGFNLVSCGSDHEVNGTYHGDMTIEDPNPNYKKVKIEVSSNTGMTSFEVFSLDKPDSPEFSFSATREGGGVLLRSKVIEGGKSLLSGSGSCLEKTEAKNKKLVRICRNGETLSFTYQSKKLNISINAKKTTENSAPMAARTEVFSLDQVVATTRAYELNTQIRAQDALQAKHQVSLNRAMLLPRANLTTALEAVSGIGLVVAFEQLLPFVFPSNWFELDKAKHTFGAQINSYKSVKANQILDSERIYYALALDTLFYQKLSAYKTSIDETINIVQENINQGTLPVYAADGLSAERTRVLNEILEIERLIAIEKSQLTVSMGLSPADVKVEISLPTLPDLTKIEPEDLTVYGPRVKNDSYETHQLVNLIDAAESNVGVETWSFFGLEGTVLSWAPRVNIANSEMEKLNLKLNNVYNHIDKRLVEITRDLMASIKQYRNAAVEVPKAKSVITSQRDRIKGGIAVEGNALIGYHGNVIEFERAVIAAQIHYLIGMAKRNRILLEGFYENIEPPIKLIKDSSTEPDYQTY